MSTTPTAWLEPGQIRAAVVSFRLADGSSTSDEREILLLDVRHDDDTARVLWQTMSGIDEDRLPGGHDPRWSAVTGTGDPVDRDAAAMLSLHNSVLRGTYRPRDPRGNSLEILRDGAIARVQQVAEWSAAHQPPEVAEAAASYQAAATHHGQARERLYEAVRTALASGSNVYDLASVTGLTRQRIYQIRDGVR